MVKKVQDPFSKLHNALENVVKAPLQKAELSDCTKERIRALVAGHLEPYIRGYVTRYNEPLSRPSFMSILWKKLKEKEPNLPEVLREEVSHFALSEYAKRAVRGLYRWYGIDEEEIISPHEREFLKTLTRALEPALKKDFPMSAFPRDMVHTLAIRALNTVNKERESGCTPKPNYFLLNKELTVY